MERLEIMLEKKALSGTQKRKTKERINKILVASAQIEFKVTNIIQEEERVYIYTRRRNYSSGKRKDHAHMCS